VSVLGRALVLAGDTLFVAGPSDVVDQEDTITQLDGEDTAHRLAAQRDAYAGKKGALLFAVSAAEGKKLAAYRLDSMPVFDGMAAANQCLYLATTDGKVLCLADEGEPLKPGPQEPLKETPLSVVRGLTLSTSHPDFQHLSDVQVTKCDLGWRVQTPSGGVGLALKKLDAPLTKQATFKLRLLMIPNPTKGPAHRAPGNAFLAFGDAPDDARLVKCGLRNAGQRLQIALGPLLTGKSATEPAPTEVSKVMDCVVAVDLATQKVRMTMLGQTLEAELLRPLARIAYVGYAVNSVAAEFGRVEVTGE